ncbi:telomere length regulation protein TEL2 homolog isoform X2 [Parasteatoda tepidariorum]|uniref:telomere length regulation protein TEL2 homolog isoform X2 n=1 Tax=Parasteatoda tepidariorum TaxID=114398 RepID=UPI00077F996A|nr:telomere length regulation protein TEL2 homolog [Parasteatoda tepidariorum]XP_042896578.1 telomere length regulation protein TEL2 homolog [Parasteatoda tepidariorum]
MTNMSVETSFHEICIDLKKLFTAQPSDSSKWKLLKEFFDTLKNSDFSTTSSDYYFVTETLLDSLKPTLFSEEEQEKLFDGIFLQGIHHEAFIVLVKKFGESCEGYQQKKILDVLQKFLKGPSLENLILYQCTSHGIWDPSYVLLSKIWNDLITIIISLPERIANKTKGENIPKLFRNNFYVPLLASNIIKVLSVLRDKISNGQNCTLEFIGSLLGRLCITGNTEILSKKLCVEFIKRTESDFIWRKLSQNLFKKMPMSSLELFVTHMLLIIPWYGYVEWILGEETIKTEKLNYLLTNKLITFKHFEQKLILQNIIGHFASSESRQDHFWKIFQLLLKDWTNAYNLKYQSHDQQMYIAVALMICCGWFKLLKNADRTKAYLSDILNGTQLRIGNPDKFVQTIGMVVAADLLSVMDPNAEKLKFEEISDTKMVEYLQSFTKIQHSPGKDLIFFEEDLKCFKEVESSKKKWDSQHLEKNAPEKQNVAPLDDSDDDLEPFDMTSDLVLKKPKYPLYLNDCLHGIIEQEDRDWLEQCLKHAEKLITTNSDTLHELAEEMTKVVLHLENKYNIENFESMRMKILVCLATHCPLPVVKYLTTEFYEPNYNIQQRLDMLEVIAKSSFQLSRPHSDPSVIQDPEPKDNLSSKQAWKIIVEERIASKTRYITKGPKKALPEPVENLFAPIAGFFFFPLIHTYYKKNKVLKVFGEDGYVLGRLIYTLGAVIHSATNSHHAPQMAEVFLEFLPCVWNHEEIFVQEAVLFALVSLYASVPGYLLMAPDSNLQTAVYESEKWLQSVITNDLDINCQVKASFALGFLVNIIKEELPTIPGILDS